MTEFIETELNSWTQILELNKYFLSPFIFRGQTNSTWVLETSIERAIRNFSLFGYKHGYETEEK